MPGYAMVKVYADRVDADIYIGLSGDPWRSDPVSTARAAM